MLRASAYRFERKEKKNHPRERSPPYTTSTMQQEASSRLYFKPKKTMSLAQQLYEGIELGGRGPQGLITYMRTDPTRISNEAQASVKAYISQEFSQPFVAQERTSKTKAATPARQQAISQPNSTL